MPRYVYQNLETGEQYEFEQSFHAAPFTHHPQTGAPIKRLIFAPAVVFKGSGWYVNDSRNAAQSAKKADAPTCGSSGKLCGAAVD
jgi:predicted nucleic acid-binding Zn ribbon protein